VVVRGLATGEVSIYRIGRYLMRELGTALLTGGLVRCVMVAARLLLGDMEVAVVLTIAMMTVILSAAMIGTTMPLLLYRAGADPAIATGPFITMSNDFIAVMIYLGMASLLIR
jgi:magnesium transporter